MHTDNKVFGKLTVVKQSARKQYVFVMCTCGKEYEIAKGQLTRKTRPTRACRDCYEYVIHNRSHGMSKSPEYRTWASMISRCKEGKNTANKHYYYKGIEVAKEWTVRGGFERFYKEVGKKPGSNYSLDRIDFKLGYIPGNIRWATLQEQNSNKTTNKYVYFNSIRMTISQVAEQLGIDRSTLLSYKAYHNIKTHQEALDTWLLSKITMDRDGSYR